MTFKKYAVKILELKMNNYDTAENRQDGVNVHCKGKIILGENQFQTY